MKKYIFILFGILLIQSCASNKKNASSNSRYQRQPIVEVTQAQLDEDVLIIDAKTQQELGNYTQALNIYNKILSQNPNCAVAYYEKARILSMQNRSDSAIVYYQHAIKLDDDNVWYKLMLAKVYEMRQDGKNLTQIWSSVVKQNPEKLDYYYELSNAYIMAGDIPMAVATLNRVEKIVGVTEPISLQKIKLWEAIHREDKAMKEIEALADAMPQETKYSAMLAESNMRQKNYAKAKHYYDQILQANPNDEYIHISLAGYYKAVNQLDKAAEELKLGFQNPELDAKSKLQILGSFYTQEEFYGSQSKHTFEMLDMIMKQCDDSSSYALFYGDVLMHQKRYAEAAHQFELHLATDSSQYEVWEALLICLNSANEQGSKELLNYAQRASNLFPLHVMPYYMQAFIHFMNKDYEKGLAMATRCEKIGFNKGYLEAECYAIIADCNHSLGNNAECYKYYDKYLAIRPNDIYIFNNYAYYLANDNTELDKAERMSQQTIKAEPNNPTFLDTYGWVLHKLGRDAEAIKYIQKAISLDKENDETLRQHLNEIQGK